jgi:hypothetical protein
MGQEVNPGLVFNALFCKLLRLPLSNASRISHLINTYSFKRPVLLKYSKTCATHLEATNPMALPKSIKCYAY